MRWVHVICIGAATVLSACGIGAEFPDFTAKQYRLAGSRTIPGAELSGRAVYYRDDERLRYEGVLEEHGVATVIYDPAREAAYLLNSSGQSRRAFAGAQARPLALALDEGEAPQPLETAWSALGPANVRAVGRCRVAGERGVLWRTREPVGPDIVRTACITRDGIVLRLMENETTLFEAISLSRGSQPAHLFVIPETYRIVDDAELARAEEETPPGG